MRLKLRYARSHGQPPVDLLVSTDASTTVGALAEFLAQSDPDAQNHASEAWTLRVAGSGRSEVEPDVRLLDSGIVSGSDIELTTLNEDPYAQRDAQVAAVLYIISGPDEGQEFPLLIGTSVIGRGRGCDVRLADPMTSRRHAKIHVGETVEISDLGSVNGVLVGDAPAETTVLRPGDTARLGDTVISIRRVAAVTGDPGSSGSSYAFNRPPRIDGRRAGRNFPLPEMPAAPKGQRFPIIPLFAPMLIGAALYLSTKSTTSLIFVAMSPLMMGGNVVEGRLFGKRTYQRELDEFHASVAGSRAQVADEHERELAARRSENPSIRVCAEAIKTRGPLLWSRRPDLPGFGELGLGLGTQPSRSTVQFPHSRQGDPELLRELDSTFGSFATIDDVPVVAELDRGGALGVAGPFARVRGVARAYVLQLVALHSHAELAVYSVCGPGRAGDWEWLKWLPHCGSPQSPIDCEPLASSQSSIARLLGELESTIQSRSDSGRTTDGGYLPRLVVLVDEAPEIERSRVVDLAERGAPFGVWVIWVAESLSELPACCKTFVQVPEVGDLAVANFVDTSRTVDPLTIESLELSVAEDLAREMSPIVDAAVRDESQSDVPHSVSLLTLVGRDLATAPERVVERWVENRSILTGPHSVGKQIRGRPGNLRAVIGESAAGPHVLDLRLHGPHALVGGTTGAGKSEMLQSWIVGMALSNSPQRLTFLLVDYKGGSAFSDCVNLPHTVGLVTDLSPHLVRRALTSLSAELRYRENILHRKRAKDLASLERDGDPDAPPSLVIVVDEFAALVQEVPEFVDGVVNVAQRGRSLGLHLILATQRPSGVIRENLRANTNLRIALRMADAADSTDVIGTKVAAGFDPTIPGRAASRTGPIALVPFQTGYVGGWTSSGPERPEITGSTLGFSPKSTWELPVDDAQEQPADGPTDIQRLVSSIGNANEIAALPAPRKPWLPELATVYDIGRLPSNRRDDELVFAVADDPNSQQQSTLAFRPDADGNMAVFGTGNSGKSTLLRTLCLAAGFTVRGGPVHVYGLDFGARGLQMLEQLPHVGSLIRGDDFERVGRLLSMIRETIDERAARYAKVGAGSVVQYRTITNSPEEPRILLLVDGMGGMRTAYEGTEHQRLFERFLSIAADGRQVGVHVVLSADRAGAIPSALGSLIQRRVVLRMAGDNDYAMLGQPNGVLDAKSPPGRGICDGLDIQVAILGDRPDLLSQDIAVRAFAEAMRNAGASAALPIDILDDDILLDDLEVQHAGRPVFAVASDTLAPESLSTEGTFTLAGPPGSGRTTTLLTIATSFRRWRPDARLIYFGTKRSLLASAVAWDLRAYDMPEAAELAPKVAAFLGEADGGGPPGLVVIENLTDFVQGPADSALQEMIKKVAAMGHLVVSDGEPTPLSGLQPLLQAARSSRVGLVLQPEQADGTVLRSQFPRVKKADFPAGRGLYVAKGQPPAVVQVAQAGRTTH
jgi:S-DNA-T family DNA segregation ATPase FtsK/SpoIIIE